VPADVGERGHRLVEEHHAELTDRDVEWGAGDGVTLHIGDAERHVRQLLVGGAAPGELDQRNRYVCTDDRPAGADAIAGGNRRGPTAAANVEHSFPGTHLEMVQQSFGHGAGQRLAPGPDRRPVDIVPVPSFGHIRFVIGSHVTPPSSGWERTGGPSVARQPVNSAG
jgi:hypothetical protein